MGSNFTTLRYLLWTPFSESFGQNHYSSYRGQIETLSPFMEQKYQICKNIYIYIYFLFCLSFKTPGYGLLSRRELKNIRVRQCTFLISRQFWSNRRILTKELSFTRGFVFYICTPYNHIKSSGEKGCIDIKFLDCKKQTYCTRHSSTREPR